MGHDNGQIHRSGLWTPSPDFFIPDYWPADKLDGIVPATNLPEGGGGTEFLEGEGEPEAEAGTEGDFYIDTLTGTIYLKGKGGWTALSGTALSAPHFVEWELPADGIEEKRTTIELPGIARGCVGMTLSFGGPGGIYPHVAGVKAAGGGNGEGGSNLSYAFGRIQGSSLYYPNPIGLGAERSALASEKLSYMELMFCGGPAQFGSTTDQAKENLTKTANPSVAVLMPPNTLAAWAALSRSSAAFGEPTARSDTLLVHHGGTNRHFDIQYVVAPGTGVHNFTWEFAGEAEANQYVIWQLIYENT